MVPIGGEGRETIESFRFRAGLFDGKPALPAQNGGAVGAVVDVESGKRIRDMGAGTRERRVSRILRGDGGRARRRSLGERG